MIDSPDLGRLCMAMQRARLVLKFPRQSRFEMVRQFVGSHWSEEGSVKEVPLNLIALYTSIVGRKLIANNPRMMLSTWNRPFKATVATMEAWGNRQIERMQLGNTLARIVTDGLFSIGICKVALATPADSASVGWGLRAGTPFAERVDLDDFVYDVHARDFNECSFIGHRFRVPLSVIRQSKIYSRDRQTLEASNDRIYNLEGDERIGLLGRTTLAGDAAFSEWEDMVDLWEVYLPRHRLIVTLKDDQITGPMGEGRTDRPNHGKALRIQKWLGPDTGPYHILGFQVVPGNPMPLAPLQINYDLHLHINGLLRKLLRQADRQKSLALYRQGQGEMAGRVQQSNDGEIVGVDDPAGVTEVAFGGPSDGNFRLFAALKEIFSWSAGNLDILGGLSPQSKTASQDEMLNQNSSASLADMQDKVISHVTSVISALCWYWKHDPITMMFDEYKVPGLPQFSALRQVTPEQRAAIPWDQLDLQVDPYSLRHQTPEMRLAALNQLVTQVLAPMLPLGQQQGVTFDFAAYLSKWAKYANQPDVPELISIGQPVGAPASPPQPGMPAQTERTYTRRSLGANSQQAKDATLMNTLAGSSNGKKEAETNGNMMK